MTVLELEAEVAKIKDRLNRLEMALEGRNGGKQDQTPVSDRPRRNSDILAWMRDQGLIIDPPSGAFIHAVQWRDMPDQEKEAVQRELDHLPPGPMASDIIIEGRR